MPLERNTNLKEIKCESRLPCGKKGKESRKGLHSRCFPTALVNFFRANILRTSENIQNYLVLSSNICFCC